MCEFISWIEKNGEVLFLTGNDVFNTKRGLELQSYCKSKEDLTGHGAIRWYFGEDGELLKGGKEKECTNFSTPDNFPKEISTAIKRGEMWGFEDCTPEKLLRASALAEYEKVTDAALAEYQKVRDTAWAEYEKVTASALAEYEKVRAPAWAEYQKVTAPAWAEYEKVTASAFWSLFADINNRNPKWR